MIGPHPCELEDGSFDHDWRIERDWEGDPSIPNGTRDIVMKTCNRCGEEGDVTHDDLTPDDSYFYDPREDDY